MEDLEKLKKAGINIHVMATGAGAGLQSKLWEVPGSSAYLSGASFPYDQDEQAELLGFMPEHFCSPDAAIDLASAAYIKAFKFGGKKAVGVGIAASVASEKVHRGEHRLHVVVMTDDKVLAANRVLKRGAGFQQRKDDGNFCDETAIHLMLEALGILSEEVRADFICHSAVDAAKERFFRNPYFTSDGKRFGGFIPAHLNALMPGAYNPPHEGHFGMATHFENSYGTRTIFQITVNPPHKGELSVQDCLKRAKMLTGRYRLFTRDDPFYIDKARKYPNTSFIIGADALLRMFDPKWGLDLETTLKEFKLLNTHFFVGGRVIDGNFVRGFDIVKTLSPHLYDEYSNLFIEMEGRWDISSSELRRK